MEAIIVKKLLFLLLLPLLFLINVKAEEIIINDASGVYLRNGPGTNYPKVALLSNGVKVTITNTTKHDGAGCNGWYQVDYNGSTNNYICSELVKIVTNVVSNALGYYTSSSYEARISDITANIRASASTSSTLLDTLFYGTNLIILGEDPKTSNTCKSGWYYVSYYANKKGYICKNLVNLYKDITSSDFEYEKVLKDLGFPDIYIPYLTFLHKKHPTWSFKAIKTNINFNDVVNGEENKNFIQSSNPNYITSLIPAEGSSWFRANKAVTAFYLDPSNYLNEKNIFMFENLAYDSALQTADIVKALFGSSYLSNDEYVGYFMQAASEYNISPVHLASRVKQEGGANEGYTPITGSSTLLYNGLSLDGVYNYYNIGAYADSYTSNPIARGLAYAKGYVGGGYNTPWDTREKAIKYGAKFISEDYISEGQYTLYFQKFNTSPSSNYSKYTHQYMTNITAPISESFSTYNSYNNLNILETAYVFSIPVYENLPQGFVTLPVSGDTNNELSEIRINNQLVNGFDKDVTEYTHYVSTGTSSIDVSAIKTSDKSSINGLGVYEISNDMQIKIVVTSEVGTTKIYIVNVIKTIDDNKEDDPPVDDGKDDVPIEEDEKEDVVIKSKDIGEIINNLDVKVNNEYLSGIGINVSSSTIANGINSIETNAIVKITDSTDNVKTGNLITGDKITITSNGISKTYTFIIKGDISCDGSISILDLLKVQKHILNKNKLSSYYYEAADTNYDGNVNLVDLLRIQKHILGSIVLK